MGSMDLAIINVALPTLSRVFHASNASVQWTVIAYVLSLAIWIPASGRIADRIGTKRTFLIALTVFTLAARGQSAVSSGLTTFVEAIGVVAATQTAGRLYPRVGPRAMCTVGLVLLTAVIGSMATIDAQTSIWTIRATMFMAGAANSMVFLPLQTSMFTSIAQADTGDASAIFNASRQTSLALGVAILSTVVASVGGESFAAFHAAYVAAALIALIGSVTAFTLIHDADARATMVRREDPPVGDSAQARGPAAASTRR